MEFIEAEELAEKAHENFQLDNFGKAAGEFSAAREIYQSNNNLVKAAEMANNQSVVLLKLGEPQIAFDLIQGTENIFNEANEKLLMAFSIGNNASCLEALKQPKKAETEYLRCGKLLKELGEEQLYAQTMKSLSALQLKNGKQLGALATMQKGFQEIERPTLKQRILKYFLAIPDKLINR